MWGTILTSVSAFASGRERADTPEPPLVPTMPCPYANVQSEASQAELSIVSAELPHTGPVKQGRGKIALHTRAVMASPELSLVPWSDVQHFLFGHGQVFADLGPDPTEHVQVADG